MQNQSGGAANRVSTGIQELDGLLGGGLIPGTLTVVAGATGIGKSQLGLQFAYAGLQHERETGIIFDMTTRGDSQNQAEYASRMFNWILTAQKLVDDNDVSPPQNAGADAAVGDAAVGDARSAMRGDAVPGSSEPGGWGRVFDRQNSRCDYLHLFDRSGRRVNRNAMDDDQYRAFKLERVRKLDQCISFFYGNFVHGVRRCVIDGVEPSDSPADSVQLELFEYIYHQILHKDADWVARDLFRAQYRAATERVLANNYDHRSISCVLLLTTREVMLDDLITRRIESDDLLSNANSIIYMGKTRESSRMGRALHVAKHRGSRCDDRLVSYEITDSGLKLHV